MKFLHFFKNKIKNSSLEKGRLGGICDQKQEGSTLVITLILCGLIITVGLGVVRILASELQFSADLLWAERSYFAAESGVEKALLDLKGNPTLHQENVQEFDVDTLDGAETSLSIFNQINDTNNIIDIPNASALKLRLEHQIPPNPGPVDITQLEWEIITDEPNDVLLWKIICPQSRAITGRSKTLGANVWAAFGGLNGDYEWDENGTPRLTKDAPVEGFWNETSLEDKKQCWLSLQNIAPVDISLKINPNINMPPDKAKVRSVGKSGEREKIVEFLYRQKNLSPYFDFGFIQQD